MLTNIPLIINLGEAGPLTWDMAKQIIQSQHTLAIYGITAVVAVAAGLMLASWIWNVFLRRHELERAIESLKSEITTHAEKDFMKLTGRVKDEIDKMKKEIEKSVSQETIFLDAEKSRLFALTNTQMNEWENAALWWGMAVKGYAKAQKESLLRVSVEGLSGILEKCQKLTDKDKEQIKGYLSLVPEILWLEKEQIEDKLKKLPKK